jgi:hypothetical protein
MMGATMEVRWKFDGATVEMWDSAAQINLQAQ